MNSKRGLSDVVTTVIIIALALVAIAVVWVVVQNLISSNSSQIQSSENFLKLKMNIESVQNNSGKLFVLVKRDVGDGNFNAMKFVVIYQNQSSESFVQSASIDQLGLKGFLLNTSGSIEAVSKVEAYPTLIDSTGKQIVSTIYSSFEVNGAINNANIPSQPSCIPNCSGKTCGSDGCIGTCGSCNSTQTCSNSQCTNNIQVCQNNLTHISTPWVNVSCLSNNLMNQTRNTINYDSNSCGNYSNNTVVEYQNVSPCVYIRGPTNGLVLYMPFDSDFKDKSGMGNNGTANGNAFVNTTGGKYGGALQLDGNGDYVSIAHNNNLDFGTNDFTISLWTKITNTASYEHFIGTDTTSYFMFALNGVSGSIAVGKHNIAWTYSVPNNLQNNVWYNLVLSRNNGYISIYVNGAQVGSTASDTNSYLFTTIYLGAHPGVNYFSGNLDEIRIYNRSLNSSEIQSLYQAS